LEALALSSVDHAFSINPVELTINPATGLSLKGAERWCRKREGWSEEDGVKAD
jgi:hypothetical protein